MLDRHHYGARCDYCEWDTGGRLRSRATARRLDTAHVLVCPGLMAFRRATEAP